MSRPVVGKARHSRVQSGNPHSWLGRTLPLGATGQQAEALAGWILLSAARRASLLGAVRVAFLFIDSKAVLSLVRAVHGSPLKAVFRQLAPWVEPYRQLLAGWGADLWLIRTTSHSIPEWIQEADAAVAAKWPLTFLWARSPLRVEVRQLGASRMIHTRSKVVRECIQRAQLRRWARKGGPSAWLLQDPDPAKPAKGGDLCWPSPWRKEVHLAYCSITDNSRWFALRLAADRLPDYFAIRRRMQAHGGGDWADSVITCPRCGNGPDSAGHWLFKCTGIGAAAQQMRRTHCRLAAARLGIDLLAKEHRWWLLPMAAGLAHNTVWTYCTKLAGPRCQWQGARQKVLYIMVRMIELGWAMWKARCRDIQGVRK